MKMKNKQPFFTYLMMILIGAGVMTAGIFLYIDNANFKKTALQTTAAITDIKVSRDSNNKKSHTVYVKFSVNNEEYDGTLGFWQMGMETGQNVKIYYGPNNPNNFRSVSGTNFLPLILLSMSLIIFLAGFASLCNLYIRQILINKLITKGTRITATVTDIIQGNTTVNKRTCHNLICEHKDEKTGNTSTFKSDDIWTILPKINKDQPLPTINVYVDLKNPSKYYVDIDGFLNENKIFDLTQIVKN
ncbi:MAG: DUF3592 domain-containing protein [Endomicrobia bacterium]|nr:DUF3592 domain-containing protein [Endomicrobiia bacterium]MCL2506075.1 DUF3592 domain-containing protein [Endomicrobiia bacterium]